MEGQSASKPWVLIVGLKASERKCLEKNLGTYVRLNLISADRVLKMRGGDPQLILVTRFTKHKHTLYLRKIMGANRIRFVGRGGAATLTKAIQSFLDRAA